MTTVDLRQGDCLELLRAMPSESVTAIVTDPPYALQFMGKGWDRVLPSVEVWGECLRVLKPGGVLLAFGGTRTFHRLTCNIEDSGFEIRDCLSWLYGSGFPKSLAIDKAIDRQRDDLDEQREVCRWLRSVMDSTGTTNKQIAAAFGFDPRMADHWAARDTDSQPSTPTLEQVPKLLEVLGNPEVPAPIARLLLDLNGRKGQPGPDWFNRAVVGSKTITGPAGSAGGYKSGIASLRNEMSTTRDVDITTPATNRSRPWAGYGTALKPAWEPIVFAMKPTAGTFAANALEHGVAGINVDGCRIHSEDVAGPRRRHGGGIPGACSSYELPDSRGEQPPGRWPANVVHDGSDEVVGAFPDAPGQVARAKSGDDVKTGNTYGKFRRGEDSAAPRSDATKSAARFFYCAKASKKDRGEGNGHPTVKPVELMRWLVRLVKMPAGTVVLDPFMGSGSTGVACVDEGVDFIGMEREPEYVEIARRRCGG